MKSFALPKKIVVGALALGMSLVSALAVPIQLIPTGTTVTSTYYIEFSNDSDAQHFLELDSYFVPAALIKNSSSGQINKVQLPESASGYNYMVVRYEKNGPDKDLIGAFDLNGASSTDTAAALLAASQSIPTGYDVKQVFLYNTSVDDGGNNPGGGRVPDGGATAVLLGLGCLGLVAASRNRA